MGRLLPRITMERGNINNVLLFLIVCTSCFLVNADDECVDTKSASRCQSAKSKGQCNKRFAQSGCRLTRGVCIPPVDPDEYQPGTPGKVWTEEEVDIVREKIRKLLYPPEQKNGLTET